MIELRDKVKDTITGFKGIIVGVTYWLNGCVRFAVQSQTLDDKGVPTEPVWVDEQQLVILGKGDLPAVEARGGPKPLPRRTADPKQR